MAIVIHARQKKDGNGLHFRVWRTSIDEYVTQPGTEEAARDFVVQDGDRRHMVDQLVELAKNDPQSQQRKWAA